jgi:hypothetical protein
MKRIVLTFGLISGGVIAALMAITMPLCLNGTLDIKNSEILGYTSMILAFLLVFFGIRSYRENVEGGTITFGRAFKVGILITLVCSAIYVLSWEIVYYNFIPDFADRYAARVMKNMQDHGSSAAELEAQKKEMAQFKVMYANPFFNVGMTFLEIFPVGLAVTLISAAILRKKGSPDAPATAARAVA